MSEFQEGHTVSRLIGSPPGYVGYEDSNLSGGKLIADVSKKPFSILLFDEIEKAFGDFGNNPIFALQNLPKEVYNHADHRFKRLRKH